MSKVVVFDCPRATLWYHPDKKIVHHQIHKFIFGDEFHQLLLAGTEALRKNRATKWLSDDRSNSVLPREEVEWGQTNWFPQTVRAGWKYWAIVQPEKVIAQMNMKSLAEEYAKAGITARFFSDPDEALRWLESVN